MANDAGLLEFTPRLEEFGRRFRFTVGEHPAAALAVAALAGISLAFVPRRWKIGALAMGARALAPLALRQLDAALDLGSHETRRRR